AGVNRPSESVLAFDRHDLADLHDVEQGGDARGDVLAEGGGRGEQSVVMAHQRGRDRGDILGQLVLEVDGVGDMDLADAGDFCACLGNAVDALAGDEQMHFAKFGCGGHGGEGGILDRGAVMLDQYKRLHATTPKVLSLAINSSTDATLSPAWRLGGSVTLRISRRGAASTPKSAGVFIASGFDLAFMMLGSEA